MQPTTKYGAAGANGGFGGAGGFGGFDGAGGFGGFEDIFSSFSEEAELRAIQTLLVKGMTSSTV